VQLVAAMDVTLQELQTREAAAAAQRLYKAAEGLNAAAVDLAALRVEYDSLVRTTSLTSMGCGWVLGLAFQPRRLPCRLAPTPGWKCLRDVKRRAHTCARSFGLPARKRPD